MSSILKRKSNAFTAQSSKKPINEDSPVRIAVLGGPKSGKTSIISKLSLGNFSDTYYPTHSVQPILFQFSPNSDLANSILDENVPELVLNSIKQNNNIQLSPVLNDSFKKIIPISHNNTHSHIHTNTLQSESVKLVVKSKNNYYISYNTEVELSNSEYTPPHITPILVELIDTQSFDPNLAVPFLEASLYVKLDKGILHNLANEPRKPVSTNPLLVASGASELNGNIDGYFFVYSAVPSQEPPSYEEITSFTSNISTVTTGSSKSIISHETSELPDLEELPGDKTFHLLSIMKGALDEAWKEYYNFKRRWNQGKEHDIFSFKEAMKSLWSEQNLIDGQTFKREIRGDTKMVDNPTDPSDPDSPPPIWLICTHIASPFASPKLIENGEKVAEFWKCGFVGIDNTNDNIDEALALLIREITERKKLQRVRKK
ncbi:uncharacterized protein RJT21DRAFT_111335 [Scheffersomyces amazonensis]|uniref:uncharacterized protein n=1 Tax=Scheffersomyces amazonensis TaxID=1078765 RepID=UPI00315C8CF2